MTRIKGDRTDASPSTFTASQAKADRSGVTLGADKTIPSPHEIIGRVEIFIRVIKAGIACLFLTKRQLSEKLSQREVATAGGAVGGGCGGAAGGR